MPQVISGIQEQQASFALGQQPAAASAGESRQSLIGQQQLEKLNNEKSGEQQPLQRQYPPNHPLGNTKHLCSICGDRATGKHYGVYSCEGCKGFFKRTIRKDIVYVCRASGQCLIDMRQRNRCQYCRYQKCLRQGMKREAVQEEKQRLKLRACGLAGSAQHPNPHHLQQPQPQPQEMRCDSQSSMIATKHHSPSNMFANCQPANPYQAYRLEVEQPGGGQFDSSQQHQGANPHLASPAPLASSNHQHYNNSHSHSNGQQQASGYLSAPQQQLHEAYRYSSVMRDYSSHYNSEQPHDQSLLSHPALDGTSSASPQRKCSRRIDQVTLKWAAQVQVEQLVEWAKSVPKFQELLIDDQITLLKAHWNELIISNIAYKSIEALKENQPLSRRSLCIGRGLFVDQDEAAEVGLGGMFGRIISELVVRLHDMRVDQNEIACLRAIILFNPETQGLKTSQPIEEYRSNVYTALELYCRKSYEDQPNRFGKLLLRLPALRSIGLKCQQCLRAQPDLGRGSLFSTQEANQNISYPSSSPASCSSSSAQHSSGASSSPASITTSSIASSSPNCYEVKQLFFDLGYGATLIDSFLKSSLLSTNR